MIEITEVWITTDSATAFLEVTEAWIESSSTSGVTRIEITEAWIEASTNLNIAPLAIAGPDQTVEPWAVVTLNGSESNDPDGGMLVSWTWSQTAGVTITLNGSGAIRTFQAPGTLNGDTLTFSLVVNDGSANSAADTVSITVLSATERVVSGGQEVPARLMSVSS